MVVISGRKFSGHQFFHELVQNDAAHAATFNVGAGEWRKVQLAVILDVDRLGLCPSGSDKRGGEDQCNLKHRSRAPDMIGPGQAGCGYLRQLETLNFGRLKPPNFSESEMRKLPIFIGIHRLSLYFVEASSHGYDYQQVTLLHMSNERQHREV